MKKLVLLWAIATAGADTTSTFKKALSAIVAPAASGPMPNIGQGAHLLTVMFPTATADITSIQVRIEASYNNVLFFPISEDVTTAKYTGSFAYGMARGNGNFPYIRVRAVAASASKAMDAWYTGSMFPIANVTYSTDRFIVTPPGAPAAASAPYIYSLPLPIPANWTNVEFDMTHTTRNDLASGIILLHEAGGAGVHQRFICTPVPTPPYKARFMLQVPQQYGTNDAGFHFGISLRETVSTKSELFEIYQSNSSQVNRIQTSNQAWGGNQIGPGSLLYVAPWAPITFQVSDDGTNRRYRFWDGLVESILVAGGDSRHEVAIPNTQYISPDALCVYFERDNGNYATYVNFLGYELVAP